MKEREVTILGLSLVIAAFILGAFFLKARATDETIQVVGSATQRFESDIVKWQFRFSRLYEGSNSTGGYASIREDLDKVIAGIRDHGIDAANITIQPSTTNAMRDRDGALTGYRVTQSFFVISDRIADIEELALDPDPVISNDLIVDQSRLEYYYSGVDELKRELLGDAAADARMRAEGIANSTGVKVGKVKSARAGVFQITEPYSTEVAAYGVYDTSSRQKDIKVTVHAEFLLQ